MTLTEIERRMDGADGKQLYCAPLRLDMFTNMG